MLYIPYLGFVPMTNTKRILGISLAAVFAISMIAGTAMASGIPGYLDIEKVKIKTYTDEDGDTFLKAKIKTDERIPKFGKEGAIGYGIILAADGNGNPENVLALTSHRCASDSYEQWNAPNFRCPDGTIGFGPLVPSSDWGHNDGANFHAHNLDVSPLGAGDLPTACTDEPGATHYVDVPRTIGSGAYPNADISPDWPVWSFGKTIVVGNVPLDEIGDGSNTTPVATVSFEILPQWNEETGDITALCLAVYDLES